MYPSLACASRPTFLPDFAGAVARVSQLPVKIGQK